MDVVDEARAAAQEIGVLQPMGTRRWRRRAQTRNSPAAGVAAILLDMGVLLRAPGRSLEV
jgi:hypothetical protein